MLFAVRCWFLTCSITTQDFVSLTVKCHPETTITASLGCSTPCGKNIERVTVTEAVMSTWFKSKQQSNSSFTALMKKMDGSTVVSQTSSNVQYAVEVFYPHEEAKSTERRGRIQPLRSERGSVMHEDSGVVSWITDYKDTGHALFVSRAVCWTGSRVVKGCLKGLYCYLQQQSNVWVCRLWHCLVHTWETQNAEFMNSPSLACTLRPRFLKFWLNSPWAQCLNLFVVSLLNWAFFWLSVLFLSVLTILNLCYWHLTNTFLYWGGSSDYTFQSFGWLLFQTEDPLLWGTISSNFTIFPF